MQSALKIKTLMDMNKAVHCEIYASIIEEAFNARPPALVVMA